MRVLLVGGGGREHALAWAIARSPLCEELICAPGNAGIADLAPCLPIGAEAIERLIDCARHNRIDLAVIGPEAPLVAGLADRLRAEGVAVFGPGAKAARLEGSKAFMKDLCRRHGVPTAAYARFADADAAKAYIREQGAPIVIKADGLAAGKGVVIAHSLKDAETAVDDALLRSRFGQAGAEIVIEEFLSGEECSFFALVADGHAVAFGSAQDHKPVGEGDTGPNTGGMGAYSPAPVLTPVLERRVMAEILGPTLQALSAEGIGYRGVLFAGLMICQGPDGPQPKLLEYNVRFGDPECQTLMMRLQDDALACFAAAARGALPETAPAFAADTALCVVMAAKGYPGSYTKGTVIRGVAEADGLDGVQVFHAGTERDDHGRLLASGGRVLGFTALGDGVAAAQARAYRAVDCIAWPDGFCRRDIGWRAAGR